MSISNSGRVGGWVGVCGWGGGGRRFLGNDDPLKLLQSFTNRLLQNEHFRLREGRGRFLGNDDPLKLLQFFTYRLLQSEHFQLREGGWVTAGCLQIRMRTFTPTLASESFTRKLVPRQSSRSHVAVHSGGSRRREAYHAMLTPTPQPGTELTIQHAVCKSPALQQYHK